MDRGKLQGFICYSCQRKTIPEKITLLACGMSKYVRLGGAAVYVREALWVGSITKKSSGTN